MKPISIIDIIAIAIMLYVGYVCLDASKTGALGVGVGFFIVWVAFVKGLVVNSYLRGYSDGKKDRKRR